MSLGSQQSVATVTGRVLPSLGTAQWYAVYTRARHEKSVVAQLRWWNVCTFLPLVSALHRWSDRRQVVDVPLFPGYVFVQIVYEHDSRLSVLRAAGVVRFVGFNGMPVPIPDKQIENIQRVLESRIVCAPYPFYQVGQRLRICGGALDGIQGVLLEHKAGRSLVLSVELIQRSVVISIEGLAVEVV